VAAKDSKEQLNKYSIPATKLSSMITAAEQALSSNDFETAKKLSQEIEGLAKSAVQSKEIIDELTEKIRSRILITGAFAGPSRDYSQTRELLHLASAALQREDFTTALQRAEQAKLSLALQESSFDPVIFLIDNLKALSFFLIALIVSIPVGYLSYSKRTITKKILLLNKEEDAIRDKMIKLQKDHFSGRSAGVDYLKTIDHLTHELSKLRNKRTSLRHRRISLLSKQIAAKDAQEEKQEILKSVGKLQQDYYTKKTVPRSEFAMQGKAYSERLAEIEEDLWQLNK
jgi:hypothetical protein